MGYFRPNLSQAASDKVRYFTEKYPDLAPDGTHVCNFLINACADWLDWAYGQISLGRPIGMGRFVGQMHLSDEPAPNERAVEAEVFTSHAAPTAKVPRHIPTQQDDFLAELGSISMD